MVSDYKDFAEYVLTNFPGAKKMVEEGIGRDRSVYDELKSSFVGELVATDINPGFQDVVRDDITAPNMKLYKGSTSYIPLDHHPNYTPISKTQRRILVPISSYAPLPPAYQLQVDCDS